MAYKVRLDVFEGPFDLLVYLIEHARMDIKDIRISEITTQYLDYIREMQAQDIAVGQEFMVLAAELIEIKSRMLLPCSAEETLQEEEDPRQGLAARLLEYKQFREIAAFLDEQMEVTSHSHTKPREELPGLNDPDLLITADLEAFAEAFRSFLFRRQRFDEVRRVYDKAKRSRMSIETRIKQIRGYFLTKNTVKFSEMIAQDSSAFNKVITFMSLLELLKAGDVDAQQPERYGDITVTLLEKKEA